MQTNSAALNHFYLNRVSWEEVKYILSKILGIILGIIMIIAAFGYGILYLVGTSLGNALGSELNTTESGVFTLGILLIICILGILTAAGIFGLKFKTGKIVYIGFCLLIGVVLLITFLTSIGAFGRAYE